MNQTAQTRPPYSETIEVGMTVVVPSDSDNSRPSSKRLKVINIVSKLNAPLYLNSVLLEDGNTYSGYQLFYPKN